MRESIGPGRDVHCRASSCDLSESSKLGALLGAEAMGEVFCAQDTRLNREVAIAVLPKEFAANADRLRDPQSLGDGEDELAVRDFGADVLGHPLCLLQRTLLKKEGQK